MILRPTVSFVLGRLFVRVLDLLKRGLQLLPIYTFKLVCTDIINTITTATTTIYNSTTCIILIMSLLLLLE